MPFTRQASKRQTLHTLWDASQETPLRGRRWKEELAMAEEENPKLIIRTLFIIYRGKSDK